MLFKDEFEHVLYFCVGFVYRTFNTRDLAQNTQQQGKPCTQLHDTVVGLLHYT